MNTWRMILVASGLAVGLGWGVHAGERRPVEPSVGDLVQQVKTLEARVEQLEGQISQMGTAILAHSQPDSTGVLHDATGQPVGVWGTDPSTRVLRANVD